MQAIHDIFEKDLVARIKRGDEKAFELAFEQYKNYLYLFVCKALPAAEDAESIVQEIFINLWLSRDNLDKDKPLKPYLFTIAKNQIYDHLRKIYSKRKYLDSLFLNYSAKSGSTENEVEYWDFERFLMEKINQLPEKRRKIYVLSKLEGKSYREIAELLGISENTVDMQMRSANSAISKAIKNYLTQLILFLSI
ncbi:MAG: RNA polymerase sigma-70 factor [Prolixibacteraceae bacterium]|jgi:RNA polymerase sigma-70 factor (ECF subfamily)|nr:RNA polymerase sigma-70 factor [Prolixibacteraceae bacterium]